MTDNEQKLRDYLKRVADELQQTRRRLTAIEARDGEPVAVVAMACRYPGAVRSPEDLWDLVAAGGDAVGDFPADRGWDVETLYDPDPGVPGRSYVRQAGFVHDAGDFDADFFGISPREALAMDPQQRLVLEASWELFERAGIDVASLRGSGTGVFIGAGANRYIEDLNAIPEGVEGYSMTGNVASVLSGRLSYTYGFEGPAVTVDTACSSSLVALHLAVRALRQQECGLAVVGGVTVMSDPALFVEFSRQRGLAADGRCKAFAAAADGTGWSEGAGLLLVERLSDARRNGHPVLALVRGSAVNQDGASSGLTAPSGPSQQRVIAQALQDARLTPDQVDAVEAHGTGTRLGDPIEAQALIAAYGAGRAADRPLWLGALKSNIGHSAAASGVAGVIKTVMALRHGVLPKTLHVDEPTPHVDWSAGAVRLLTEARPWPETGRARRAGVSSFGISGTNAHVVLEEAGEQAGEDAGRAERRDEGAGRAGEDAGAIGVGVGVGPTAGAGQAEADQAAELPVVPWFVSARSEAGLRAQARKLADHVEAHDGLRPVDVAYSLAATRSALDLRGVVMGTGREDLLRGLRSLADGVPAPGVEVGPARVDDRLAFLFTGQGSQRLGMGRQLWAAFPAFSAALDEVFEHFDGLREVVFGDDAELLDRTEFTQPALFALEVALFRLVESFGVRPDFLAGHSIGELAAAHVAGVWSLADAARVVAARGRLMQELPAGGAMVAVQASEAELLAALDGVGGAGIAAVNGPSSVVVSGDEEPVLRVADRFAADGRKTRRLRVSHAFHSARMEPMLDGFRRVLEQVSFAEPRIPVVSNLTGDQAALADPGYWVRQVREAVRFGEGVEWLVSQGASRFLEVGPDGVLSAMARESIGSRSGTVAVPLLRPDRPEADSVTAALARLHVAGVGADWAGMLGRLGGTRVELPTFAFQRRRFWLESKAAQRSRDPLDERRYRAHWKQLPETAGGRLTGTWLVVSLGADGLAEECVRALEARGAVGRRMDVSARELSREALAERLRDAGGIGEDGQTSQISGVISLLGLESARHTAAPQVSVGLIATLALVQALCDTGVRGRLWCLTRGAVSTGAADPAADIVQSQVWGFGRTAALEHPALWGGLIDLPASPSEALWSRVAALIADGSEDQAAVRAAGVFVRRLRRAPGSGSGAGAERGEAAEWTPAGKVLITGGTSGLGARVARWAAARGAAHLVLVGRRGSRTPGVRDLEAELAGLGARVEIAACDVADREALAELVARTEADGDPVRAVVHTVGVPQDRAILDTDPAHCAEIVAGKAVGGENLDAVFGSRELDAFVLFSSVAGVWGGGVQGIYAAANAYLDALAEDRRARGLNATSVAWGPWGDEGMVGAERDVDRLARRGLRAIDAESGLRALARVVADGDRGAGLGAGAIAVADVDWSRFARGFTALRPSPLISELSPVSAEPATPEASVASTAFARRLAQTAEPERPGVVLELVRSEVARVLGHASVADVSADRAFRDLGFDSLAAVELRDRLIALAGVPLISTVVFDYPTPAALAAHLSDELSGGHAIVPAGAGTAAGTAASDFGEPIAIVGMACRYPAGVTSPEDLWTLVASGGDAVSGFPADRGWDLDGLYHPDPDHPGTSYTRHGGFLEGVADFDPAFFGISPREALAMDPQQRLLLETSWEVLERAGLDPGTLKGTPTGVFIGGSPSGYASAAGSGSEGAEGYALTGSAGSVLSGRLAYTFGLEGPAVTVDTACSSSLVALHLAVQALRRGECRLAMAGGVAVMAVPTGFVEFSRQRGLAVDGRCKAFAAAADGTGWSEGAGVLLLERLSDARRNGRRVLAVVRGSAVNQDGASNGLSAPNGPSQQRVIRLALADARLTPDEVDAVEAHGTGTALGDPIEAHALLAVYGRGRDPERPLRLGSVKSNIGHSAAAAGVAGVIKTVMALRHGVLPKTLHVDAPTPHVDWSGGGVELLTEAAAWPRVGRLRRAGVSSFGISGTNAHVILEQAPDVPAAAPNGAPVSRAGDDRPLPFVLSAASGPALRAHAGRLLSWLNQHPDDGLTETGPTGPTDPAGPATLTDLAAALVSTRAVLDHRGVVVARDRGELARGLRTLADGQPGPRVVEGAGRPRERVVFVFPGQGSQWPGMAAGLLAESAEFASRMAACEAALAPHVDWSLTEILDSGSEDWLERVDIVQPALWAVMVSLAEVWRAHGLRPAAVVGHSQGEIAAACVAGALSLQDGAKIVALRSRLLREVSGRGVMASIALPTEKVAEHVEPFGGRIAVAAANGPGQTVVSGDPDAVGELIANCEKDGVRARLIPVDYASHSHHVEPIRERLIDALAGIRPRTADVPFHSTVTNTAVDTTALDAEYWYENLRRTVQFEQAVESLMEQGHGAFVELSPHPTLLVPVEEIAERCGSSAVAIGTLRRGEGGMERFLTSLAQAFATGVAVRLDAAIPFGDARPQAVDLPTYPFQRRRYWPDAVPGRRAGDAAGGSDAVEEKFWDLVESEDLQSLASLLDVAGDQRLDTVVPALRTWRRRSRDSRLIDGWRYKAAWQPWAATPSAASPAKPGGTWLALVPADLEGDSRTVALLAGLEAAGAGIVPVILEPVVDRGELAKRLGPSWQTGSEPAGVLSLLGLSATRLAGPGKPGAVLGTGLASGLTGTVTVLQALTDLGVQTRLWCLTRGAVAVGDERAPGDADAAGVWGLGRVAALEAPEVWGGLVDLPGDVGPDTAAVLLACLGNEDHEDQLAIRGSGVHVRRMVRTPLAGAEPVREWQPRGSILITGGAGPLDRLVARRLAERGAEHVVLAGRDGEDLSDLIAELDGLGTRVTVAGGDLSEPKAFEALTGRMAAEGTVLTAVMHTAGTSALAPLTDIGSGELAEAVAVKVETARAVDRLAEQHPVETVVYFSSVAAFWGSGDHGACAAADAQLDALAYRHRAHGRHVVSVAWPVWDVLDGFGAAATGTTAGTDAGTGIDPDAARAVRAARRVNLGGLRLLDPGRALDALQQALDHDDTHVAVADVEWRRFAEAFTAQRPSRLLDGVPEARQALAAIEQEARVADDAAAELRQRLGELPAADRARRLLELVRAQTAAALGHDSAAEITPERAFSDLGLESITAVELRNRLNRLTGLRLPATVLFDHPTPRGLADVLLGEMFPDGLTDAAFVHGEIDRLAAGLQAATVGGADRAGIAKRLQGLLARWNSAGAPEPAPAAGALAVDQLADASDEEMLEFINSQLGKRGPQL